MSLMNKMFIKKKSALIAKERLQIILAHENAQRHPEWLPDLQRELVAVVAKYIKIDKNSLTIHLEKRDNLDLLEINVPLPDID